MTTKGSKPQRYLFLYFALLSTLGLFASDMYLPALKQIQEYFSTNPGTVALSMSVYMVSFSIAQLLYGPISDQVGRKLPLLVGLVIFLVGTLGCVYSANITMFLIFRAVQALGVGAAYVMWQPMVIDSFAGDDVHKLFARLMALGSISPAFAPVLGGLMADSFGWQSVFGLLIGITIVLIGWTLSGYQQNHVSSSPSDNLLLGALKNYQYLLRSNTFITFSIPMACGIAMYLVILTLLPLIFSGLGYAAKSIGLMYLPLVLAFLLGAELSRRSYNRLGVQGSAMTGILLGCIGATTLLTVALLDGWHTRWLLMLPFALVTLGNGFLIPASMAHLMQYYSDCSGSCASLVGGLMALAGFFTIFIASSTWDTWGMLAMVSIIFVSALVMLCSFLFGIKGVATLAS